LIVYVRILCVVWIVLLAVVGIFASADDCAAVVDLDLAIDVIKRSEPLGDL